LGAMTTGGAFFAAEVRPAAPTPPRAHPRDALRTARHAPPGATAAAAACCASLPWARVLSPLFRPTEAPFRPPFSRRRLCLQITLPLQSCPLDVCRMFTFRLCRMFTFRLLFRSSPGRSSPLSSSLGLRRVLGQGNSSVVVQTAALRAGVIRPHGGLDPRALRAGAQRWRRVPRLRI
jgi:hypothetical protein